MKKLAITTAALGLAAFMAIGLAGISPAWADDNDNDYGYHKVKPVGLWHFNRAYQEVLGTPPDLTPDNSCNDNDGEFVGDAGLLAGKFKNGLVLDGDGDLVQIPNSDALSPANVTVEAWVKADGQPADFDYILAKNLDTGKASYALYTGGGTGLFFYVSDATGFYRSSDAGNFWTDGNWHHIAGTYDGTDVRLFVDGMEVGTATAGPAAIDYVATVANGDVTIGGYGTNNPRFAWTGRIDEVSIWDQALSDTKIAEHASSDRQLKVRCHRRRHHDKDHDKDHDHDHDHDHDYKQDKTPTDPS